MGTSDFRPTLEAAQASGETITVRYSAGGIKHRYGLTVTGTVEGFVHRPREAEKARIRRAGETLLTTDVPLRAITAIETPARITTPDRALMGAVVERLSTAGVVPSGPYYSRMDFPDHDDPYALPLPDLITQEGGEW